MPKRPTQSAGTLDPVIALRGLVTQLAALNSLKGRKVADAEDEEREWEQLTQSILERVFGKESSNVGKFHGARWSGSHAVRDVYEYHDDGQEQINFDLRQRAYASLIRGAIAELKLVIPDDEVRGTYQAGEAYEFYRDLSALLTSGTREVFIIDAYLDEVVFNLYVDKIPAGTSVRILTGKTGKNVGAIATLYAKGKQLQLRISTSIHDRALFIDNRGLLVGQSIKDAAHDKPTTVTEMSEPMLTLFRDAHETIWLSATILV
jgi:hypothetical protein